MLGHAADDREHGARPLALERAELGGARDHALLGLLAHRARVDEDDVGLVGARGRRVARIGEHAADQVAVGDVHLAAVGLDVHAAARRRPGCGPRGRACGAARLPSGTSRSDMTAAVLPRARERHGLSCQRGRSHTPHGSSDGALGCVAAAGRAALGRWAAAVRCRRRRRACWRRVWLVHPGCRAPPTARSRRRGSHARRGATGCSGHSRSPPRRERAAIAVPRRLRHRAGELRGAPSAALAAIDADRLDAPSASSGSTTARASMLDSEAATPHAALALVEEATALRPDVPAIQHTRARALLAVGRIDDAISVLRGDARGGELPPHLEAERCRDLARAWEPRARPTTPPTTASAPACTRRSFRSGRETRTSHGPRRCRVRAGETEPPRGHAQRISRRVHRSRSLCSS